MQSYYFQGRHTRLRAVEPSDAETHFLWNQDSEMTRNIDDIWFPGSREGTKQWAERTALREPADHVGTMRRPPVTCGLSCRLRNLSSSSSDIFEKSGFVFGLCRRQGALGRVSGAPSGRAPWRQGQLSDGRAAHELGP